MVERAKGNPLNKHNLGFDRHLVEPKRVVLCSKLSHVVVPGSDEAFNFDIWARYQSYCYATIRVSVDQLIGEFVLHPNDTEANKRSSYVARSARRPEKGMGLADKAGVARRLKKICADVGAPGDHAVRAACIASWIDENLGRVNWKALLNYFHDPARGGGVAKVEPWIAGGPRPPLANLPPVWLQ